MECIFIDIKHIGDFFISTPKQAKLSGLFGYFKSIFCGLPPLIGNESIPQARRAKASMAMSNASNIGS